MIIGYDKSPELTIDQKLMSLVENIQLALNEKADVNEVDAIKAAVKKLQEDNH